MDNLDNLKTQIYRSFKCKKCMYLHWIEFFIRIFLAKMLWFPVKVMVLFPDVVIALYLPIKESCFSINILTSLKEVLLPEEFR